MLPKEECLDKVALGADWVSNNLEITVLLA